MTNGKLKILMVVDVQNSFCPGGELAVPDGDQIVPYINSLLLSNKYERCIASMESHPADHKSFASQHEGKRAFLDTIDVGGITQQLWPDHCVAGSHGEKFHPDLKVNLIDKFVVKGLDPVFHSFSSFWQIPDQKQTILLQYILAEANREGIAPKDVEIDVVGLALDYCVRDTAIDAAKFGLSVTLLLPGTRAVNVFPGDDQRAIELMEQAGVRIDPGRTIPLLVEVDFVKPDSRVPVKERAVELAA